MLDVPEYNRFPHRPVDDGGEARALGRRCCTIQFHWLVLKSPYTVSLAGLEVPPLMLNKHLGSWLVMAIV